MTKQIDKFDFMPIFFKLGMLQGALATHRLQAKIDGNEALETEFENMCRLLDRIIENLEKLVFLGEGIKDGSEK